MQGIVYCVRESVCIGCACNVSHMMYICVYKMFGVRKMYFLTKAEFI